MRGSPSSASGLLAPANRMEKAPTCLPSWQHRSWMGRRVWVCRTCEVSWASRFDPLLVKIMVLKCLLPRADSSYSHQVDANCLGSRNDGKHRYTGIAEQGGGAARSSEGRKVSDPNCRFVHF